MLDPIQRRQYGIAALLVSVVFLTVSAGAAVGNAIRRDTVVQEINASSQECENRLKILGATRVAKTDEKIVVEWTTLDGGYTLVGDASAAAMACPGWTMRKFCMGQECQNSSVKLELGKSL